ncbi:uncharacterized protein [Henckelia pumila]|uniref:uncharacterized protein n=1 Tax=Henckelia pumila TaxID=405737 RepID=UPI003C6E0440
MYQQTIFSGADEQPTIKRHVDIIQHAYKTSPQVLRPPQRAPFLANKRHHISGHRVPPPSQMRRGRPRKPRLTRMDAAVDAMAPLGFTQKQVQKAVKGLLKVYDGNDAWPVIEESSYTLLLEVMLNDVEVNREQGAEVANDSKDNCLEEGTSGIASNTVLSGIQQHEEREEGVLNLSVVVAELIINEGGAEVLPNETTENLLCKTARDSDTGLQLAVKSSSSSLTPPATDAHPSRKRWPCHGWIDSDEDEEPNDFIMYLNPA